MTLHESFEFVFHLLAASLGFERTTLGSGVNGRHYIIYFLFIKWSIPAADVINKLKCSVYSVPRNYWFKTCHVTSNSKIRVILAKKYLQNF